MLYFMVVVAVVVFWMLFKRLVQVLLILALLGIAYLSLTDSKFDLTEEIGRLMSKEALSEFSGMVGDQFATALSFYSAMSDESGSLDGNLKALNEGKADPKGQALLFAVSKGQKKMAEILIKNQTDVNVRDGQGRTPLIIAAINHHSEIIKMLLASKADANIKDDSGITALGHATIIGHMETFNSLINSDSDQNSMRNKGAALVIAAGLNRINMVQMLLRNHADVNVKDEEGKTALMYAAAKGYADMVRLLVNHGANVNETDKEGHTALTFAKQKKFIQIIQILQNGDAA